MKSTIEWGVWVEEPREYRKSTIITVLLLLAVIWSINIKPSFHLQISYLKNVPNTTHWLTIGTMTVDLIWPWTVIDLGYNRLHKSRSQVYANVQRESTWHVFTFSGSVYGRRQPSRLVHLHFSLRTSQGRPRVIEVIIVQPPIISFQQSTCDTVGVKELGNSWLQQYISSVSRQNVITW